MKPATKSQYQLAVLELQNSDNIEFLTAQDLFDNGIIIGARFKTNKNGKLYLSTKNESDERTQAIYCNQKLTHVSKDGQKINTKQISFAYITPKEGQVHEEGPNKGQLMEPFFVACRAGSEDEWYTGE